jgi:hypothetical protein
LKWLSFGFISTGSTYEKINFNGFSMIDLIYSKYYSYPSLMLRLLFVTEHFFDLLLYFFDRSSSLNSKNFHWDHLEINHSVFFEMIEYELEQLQKKQITKNRWRTSRDPTRVSWIRERIGSNNSTKYWIEIFFKDFFLTFQFRLE